MVDGSSNVTSPSPGIAQGSPNRQDVTGEQFEAALQAASTAAHAAQGASSPAHGRLGRRASGENDDGDNSGRDLVSPSELEVRGFTPHPLSLQQDARNQTQVARDGDQPTAKNEAEMKFAVLQEAFPLPQSVWYLIVNDFLPEWDLPSLMEASSVVRDFALHPNNNHSHAISEQYLKVRDAYKMYADVLGLIYGGEVPRGKIDVGDPPHRLVELMDDLEKVYGGTAQHRQIRGDLAPADFITLLDRFGPHLPYLRRVDAERLEELATGVADAASRDNQTVISAINPINEATNPLLTSNVPWELSDFNWSLIEVASLMAYLPRATVDEFVTNAEDWSERDNYLRRWEHLSPGQQETLLTGVEVDDQDYGRHHSLRTLATKTVRMSVSQQLRWAAKVSDLGAADVNQVYVVSVPADANPVRDVIEWTNLGSLCGGALVELNVVGMSVPVQVRWATAVAGLSPDERDAEPALFLSAGQSQEAIEILQLNPDRRAALLADFEKAPDADLLADFENPPVLAPPLLQRLASVIVDMSAPAQRRWATAVVRLNLDQQSAVLERTDFGSLSGDALGILAAPPEDRLAMLDVDEEMTIPTVVDTSVPTQVRWAAAVASLSPDRRYKIVGDIDLGWLSADAREILDLHASVERAIGGSW